MANRIEVDVVTKQQNIVPLTPVEEADAVSRTQAEMTDPIRIKETADAIERADAKAVAALLYLANHTNAEIRAFIDSNINVASVTDLASAKACLNRMENRIEDLAVGLAVFVRRELR